MDLSLKRQRMSFKDGGSQRDNLEDIMLSEKCRKDKRRAAPLDTRHQLDRVVETAGRVAIDCWTGAAGVTSQMQTFILEH